MILREKPRRAVRVAFTNHKGGQGKTACCKNVAASLAEAGYRVLVVDLDSQGNVSRRLAYVGEKGHVTVSDILRHLAEFPSDPELAGCAVDAIHEIGWPAPYSDLIHLIPSRVDLENRVNEAGVPGAVRRLAHALSGPEIDEAYDFILIDCPPNLGHLFQLALYAADLVICPLTMTIDGFDGTYAVRDFITRHAADMGRPDLSVLACIVTIYDAREGTERHHLKNSLPALAQEIPVWEPILVRRSSITAAADNDPPVPLRLLKKNSNNKFMATLHDLLVNRLLEECGFPRPERAEMILADPETGEPVRA